MAETLATQVDTQIEGASVDASIPLQEDALFTREDVLCENVADTETARRLKAAITYRQLLNQLEVFREARQMIYELLSAAAEDDDESVVLPRLMAEHAAGDPMHATDVHDLMDMAEVRAIEELNHDIAHGHETHKEAPLEVLQARFYASYRERTGADTISPDETI